jgi:hypothetical protein
MKTYYIKYKMHSADEVQGIQVLAENKEDAYSKAVYELIPQKEGELPYSAWVHSVTYKSGNYKTFNTFEGKPY